MDRRTFLLGLLAAMTLPELAAKAQKADKPPFTLVLATDLHYIAPTLTDNGAYFTRMVENADGKVMLHIESITETFVEEMIALRPDALVLSGDLTFNGARESHIALAAKLHRIADAGVPVYVLPGNHDLYMRIAARFEGDGYEIVESVTAEEFEAIYSRFGFETAAARDESSLSYAAQLAPGLRLLMLDVNTELAQGELTAQALAFARAQLKAAKDAGERVIAVTHQNLLQHNPLFSSGFVIEQAEPLRALYEEMGVCLALSGHMHTQHVQESKGGVTEIATSALCVSPNQYGVIAVGEGGLSYRTQKIDVAAWAGQTGQSDPLLSDFPAYSDAFFKLTTMRQAAQLFSDPDEAQQMGTFLADVNACYFSGRMDLAPTDRDLLARWLEQGAFFSAYLRSIFAEPLRDHTAHDLAW